ncbi:MAG: SpoIIE family protein phosphatase [Crocinitomicaceae bacterium]|nr:SpoIIE family protein phosphatase [Crocinitomicaceae bacterium]
MKRKTISRQLITNIIIPVVLVLLAYSYLNYRYNKSELQKLNTERLSQIQQEVQNLITVYDYGMRMNEIHYEARMEKVSRQLVEIFADSLDPKKADLFTLCYNLELDTSKESVYIIDTNGVIVNTTFLPDLHLDFYARGEGYRNTLKKSGANDFVTDRFSEEQVTGRIRKWSFIPTKDSLYLIELGFLSAEARQLKDMMLETVNKIADKHNDIDQVYLAMQVKGETFEGIPDTTLQNELEEVLQSKKNKRLLTETDSMTVYEDLMSIDIVLDETTMFSGMVLYIKSNDSQERNLISQSVKRFVWMVLLALIILIIIIVLRARSLTRPIVNLTKKAESITTGNLHERIQPEGNNEITQLSESFNHMIEQLQESYETLEQKVVDRTAEVVEQKNIAEHQKHLVEEKNKEILDSINYAKRIQKAILPQDKLFNAALPDSFVLYKPKDIVAGDFYWMEETKNQILFAAADCTGHGVPGALVSVVCHNALNRAVREYGLTDPGKILDKTREIVIAEFEKSDDDVKDGMDISLVAIPTPTGSVGAGRDLRLQSPLQIQWAGANNPLWVVKKDSTIILEIKPDKQPIGKYAEAKPFTTHEIDLEKGDTFYIFTDGFADQFGGDRGKKFKASSMKELILTIQNLSMSEQKERLNESFEVWRGTLEQIDDVSVIGVRI